MAAKGTPVKVVLQEGPTPDTEFKTKITVDYAAGNPPDVTRYRAAWVADFADAGYLLDLTDRLKTWSDWTTVWYPAIKSQIDVKGKFYSVPSEASTQNLFYRKDILTSLGVSTAQPKSWDDLITRAKEIRSKTNKPPLLFPAATAWGGGTFAEGFIHLMLGTRSELYNTQTGKWVVKSPGITSVFKFYETLAKEKLIPIEPLLAPEPWVALKYKMFPAGDLLITTSGSWAWRFDWGPGAPGEIKDVTQKVATWQFPPENPADPPYVWAGVGWQWTVSAKSKNPDMAFEFIKFFTSGDAMAEHLATVGVVSPRSDIAKLKPYADIPELTTAESYLGQGKFFRGQSGQDKVEKAVGLATENIITGRWTAEQAAEEFAKQLTADLGADKVEVK